MVVWLVCAVAGIAVIFVTAGQAGVFAFLLSAGQNVPLGAGIPTIFGGGAGIPEGPADPSQDSGQPGGDNPQSPEQTSNEQDEDRKKAQDERWKLLKQTQEKIFTIYSQTPGTKVKADDAEFDRASGYIRN